MATFTIEKVTDGATTRHVGDVITSTVTVENTDIVAAQIDDFTDVVPALPIGTTRTWSIAGTGGFVPPVTNGVGDVQVGGVGWTIDVGQGFVVTVNDTLADIGEYQNDAYIAGAEVDNSPLSANGAAINVIGDPSLGTGIKVDCIAACSPNDAEDIPTNNPPVWTPE